MQELSIPKKATRALLTRALSLLLDFGVGVNQNGEENVELHAGVYAESQHAVFSVYMVTWTSSCDV
jgi:hypothetical protein